MILHIDMDAFFASVEQLDNPALEGKCVIVGGRSNRSVVSAASYAARKFGVHSAMPMFQARQKCPDGIIIPPRMSRYKEISDQVMALLADFTPLVEVVSIDEAFMDVSGSDKLYGEPTEIGRKIKKVIQETIHLTCSAGIAPNKFLAKIASDLNKPDGLTLIHANDVQAFIETLPIQKVPGVGGKTGEQLARMGVTKLGDIRMYPEDALIKRLGKFGRRLKELSQGVDDSPVTPVSSSKSISSERTLSADTGDVALLKKYLLGQSETVAKGLRAEGVRARTVTLKIKYNDFKSITRSMTLAAPTHSAEAIYRGAANLLAALKLAQKVRLVGVGASGLVSASSPVQKGLFETPHTAANSWEKVDQTMDNIEKKFGKEIIRRATLKDT